MTSPDNVMINLYDTCVGEFRCSERMTQVSLPDCGGALSNYQVVNYTCGKHTTGYMCFR